MKMIFVTNMAGMFSDVLNEMGVKNRLVSFAYCGNRPQYMVNYAATGSTLKKVHDEYQAQLDQSRRASEVGAGGSASAVVG